MLLLIIYIVTKGKSTRWIADQLGVNEGDVDKYLIHPEIPHSIINRLYLNKRSIPTLNRIQKLILPNTLKAGYMNSLLAEVLQRFTKTNFDSDQLVEFAEELVYMTINQTL